MRKYETLFILRPSLEEEKRIEVIDFFKSIIAEKGEVVNVDEWGNKRLAYEIEKIREGYYVLIDFNAETDHITELERHFKINDDVMRYIVINKEEK